jgi:MYXO-CTERM domain-containing protein
MLHVVHALLPNVNAAGTGNDYIADDNDNGEGDVGEVILQYDPTDVVAGINLCLDPFADHPETRAFLEHAATQVFVYNLARKTLGSTRWTFAIQDQVSNRFADPSFAFRYPGMTTTHVSYLYGNLTTIEAVADVKVLDAAATSGPLLPGDRVDISASVTQETFLQPAPDLLVFIGLDERGDHSCADLDQNGLGDPCVALYCPPAAQLCAAIIASGASQPVVFVRPQAVDPSRIDTTGGTNPFSEIFPEALLRPDAAVWLASPYAAGRHSVNVTAFSFTSVTDLDLTNNQKVVDFEVYLGELVYGTYPAGQDPTGRTFYIRTSENHRLPRIDGGAVELNPDGSIKQAYSLILDETGTRYKFSFDDQGTEQTVTWDPQARWSRTFGKECSQLTDAEKAIDLAAVPPKDPQCRAITVVAPVAAPEEAAKSPSLQLEAGILVLGLAAFLARRRRA